MAGNPTDTSYADAVAITLSDTVVYSPPLRALFIGTASTSTLKVTTAAGNDVTFGNVAASGTVIPLQVIKVWSTGTSASNIVGLR